MKEIVKGKLIWDGQIFKIYKGDKEFDFRVFLRNFIGHEVEITIESPEPEREDLHAGPGKTLTRITRRGK